MLTQQYHVAKMVGRYPLPLVLLRTPPSCGWYCSSAFPVAGDATVHQIPKKGPRPSLEGPNQEGPSLEGPNQEGPSQGPQTPSTRPRKGRYGGTEGDPGVRYKNPWKLKLERYRRHISNLVKQSRQTEAVELLEQMKKSKVRPDVGIYNTIISGYGKQGDLKNAFKTFNEVSP
jgi:pentatricopeptide repeat protein